MSRPSVLDASFLITLGKAGRLDLLRNTPEYEWRIGSLSRCELLSAQTKGPVEQAILDGVIEIADLDSDDAGALALFAEWSERGDPGEAESIALALANGWLVALEDRAAQRRLDREVGPGHWMNCANLLLTAVRSGSLTLAEADGILVALDGFAGYRKRGVISLRQIDCMLGEGTGHSV